MALDSHYVASCLKRIDFIEDVDIGYSGHRPQAGDVVAVEITEVNSSYRELEIENGEMVELQQGDVVLGVFANRSAVKGYVGKVPETVDKGDKVDFIGSGGIFGGFRDSTKGLERPCEAEFLGYAKREDEVVNMKDYGLEMAEKIEDRPRIFAVISSRMDSGKTTLSSKIIEELSYKYNIGALKLTGSARERDRLKMLKSGAEISLDFTDVGMPSTVQNSEEVIKSSKGLINSAWSEEIDFLVVEFGAGFISDYQVKEVMRDLEIRESIFGVCAVSLDVVGAKNLRRELAETGYNLMFLSGPITDTSAGRKNVENYTGVPAYNAFSERHLEEATKIIEKEFDNLD